MPRYRTQTRSLILDAVGREFDRLGHAKASISIACRDAGVTTGALYHYFRSKGEVLDAIVAEHEMMVAEIANEARATSTSAFERLARYVVNVGRLLVRDPISRVVTRMATDPAAVQAVAVFTTWSEITRQMLIDSDQSDIALTVDLDEAGEFAAGAVVGAWLAANRGNADRQDVVLDSLTRFFLLGVVAAEHRAAADEVLARVLAT